MSDIKKKFLDILFEPPVEEIQAEAPLTSLKGEEGVNIKKEEKDNVPKAKEILYGKQDKPSSFIDYFVVPKKETKEEIAEEAYEMKENVSPIFGPIVHKEKKKKATLEKDIQKAITNNSDEYTNIVISPIYGYDVSKANDARKTLGDYTKEDKKNDNDDYLYEEEQAFEIPEDMKETIKEAIQEAVIELTPSNSSLASDDYIEEESGVVEENQSVIHEDVIEDGIEDTIDDTVLENESEEADILIEEPNAEEEIEENDIYIDDEYHDDSEFVEPEINDSLEYDFDDNSNQENEKIDNEDITSEEELTFDSFDDEASFIDQQYEESLKDNADSFDDLELNQDIESNDDDKEEIPIEESIENIQKATRSIYDTTPVQLFDFDELSENDNDEKDLFDELIGDDD